MAPKVKGLLERLQSGEYVVVAEGYIFEFERRGYLRAGPYTPEVVLEYPELVKVMHEEFVRAGSDVTLAFTYYGHREKLRIVGMKDRVEEMNREAVRIAREVADETGTLMAGNICNTTCFDPRDESTWEYARQCLQEQVDWAVEGGADYIVAETYELYQEAKMALDAIKKASRDLPAVVTLSSVTADDKTMDKYPLPQACRMLEEEGADVVGLNCSRGPNTMLPVIKQVKAACKGPVACLPVAYRTDEAHKNMQRLIGLESGTRAFPEDLDEWAIGRTCVRNFTRDCMDLGIQYLGLCCGGSAHLLRTMAETLGRTPPACKYSPNMELHTYFGNPKGGILNSDFNLTVSAEAAGPKK